MDISSKPDLPRARAPSLRLRMLVLSAAMIVATLAIAGLALVTIFERHLERRVEQELSVRLMELASGFRLDEAGRPAINKTLADPRYEQPYSGSYWQVASRDGPALRSRSLWDQELPYRDRFGAPVTAFEITGPRKAVNYMLDRDVQLTGGGAPAVYRLAVALDHAELQELEASFAGDVLRALGVIGLMLIVGSWVQITFGLRPLEVLQAQLGLIESGRSARLRGRFPDEVAPLAANLNALIDRHEEVVRRARERAGDLAHGLKTPLTILTGEARRIEEAGFAARAESVREQVGMMRAHVERELARARTHGAAVAGGALTDVPMSVERLLDLMRRMPRAGEVRFENAVPAGLRLRMDPDDFGEVLGNLLDNARRCARSLVRVSATVEGDQATVMIDDDGPGMTAETQARMRGRGESGAAPGEGSGLGLAIVGDVLGQYDTGLEIGASPASGCRVAFTVAGWIEAAG